MTEYVCASCAHKDHRWDDMRHQRDELRKGIEALLAEQPTVEFDPHGQPYQVAVPWRDRLRALLEKPKPRTTCVACQSSE